MPTTNMTATSYRHLHHTTRTHASAIQALEHAFQSTGDLYDFLDTLLKTLDPEDLYPAMTEQYDKLLDRVSELESEAADWKAEVAGLEAQVKSLEVEAATLNRDKRFLSELFYELQQKVHDLQNQLTTKEDQP